MSVVITTGFSRGIVGYQIGCVPGIGPLLQKPFGKADLLQAIQQARVGGDEAGHAPPAAP